MESKKMMKKFTPEQLQEMDRKADLAVNAMMVAAVGLGVVPILLDMVAVSAAMGAGVIAIANCYDLQLTKDDAADLIKQFFKAAGTSYSIMFMGVKITNSLLKSNPVTYVPFLIADGVVCGAAAFAVGMTAKNFFHRRAQGKKATKEEMKQWMKEGQKMGKELARKPAEEHAEKKLAAEKGA
ncbi:MAG: DUF697 domain-containing protein [Clostridia bacterium]|nr:DUF697 domain-containing protein [Clostridia bacterium]